MATNSDQYLIKIQLQVQNDRALKLLTQNLEKTAKAAPKAAKAVKRATGNTKQFGRIAQNTGYQVQDMVVQIQGGTSAMTAMSQQLPQMLIGFGAWGAAIGVVFALMPTLITLMKGANDELKDTGAEADKAAAATDRLAKAFNDMESAVSSLNLDSFVDEFQAATKAQEGLLQSTLVYRRLLAEMAADAALSNIQLPLDPGFESGQGARDAYLKQLDLFAKSVGLASEQMIVLENSFRTAVDPITSNSENIGALAVRLQELYLAGDKRNTQLKDTIELLLRAEKATRALEGADSSLLETIKVTAKAVEETKTSGGVSAAAQAAIDINDYNQMLIEAEIGQEKFNATLKEAEDAFSIMDESTDIFLRTFDSAVDGVARGTQSMSQAFESMTKSILLQIGKLLAIQAIGNALSGQGGFFGQVGAALLAEKGAVVSGGNHLTAYAKGGVVSGPTVFPMANGAGLMGESGAEAVMPLTRMSNGNLGVESSGMNVVINNNAPGVDVRPRQTEDGLTIDVVMSAVSQAVRRGGNDVSDSFEASYALNRGRAVYGN